MVSKHTVQKYRRLGLIQLQQFMKTADADKMSPKQLFYIYLFFVFLFNF